MVTRVIEALNALQIEAYTAAVALNRVERLDAESVVTSHKGSESLSEKTFSDRL